MSKILMNTLGNEAWLQKNEGALKRILPETWTHIENMNGLKIGFSLKLLGVDWRSEKEFGRVMVFLEKIGIMQRRNNYSVRGNPISVFTGMRHE